MEGFFPIQPLDVMADIIGNPLREWYWVFHCVHGVACYF